MDKQKLLIGHPSVVNMYYIYIEEESEPLQCTFRRVAESLQIDGHREISSDFSGNSFLHSLSVLSLCL